MIKQWYWLGGYVVLAGFVALMVWVVVIVLLALPISAAAPPQEADKNCVHVATANTHKIYRCIDEEANYEFYTNDLGFLMARPE